MKTCPTSSLLALLLMLFSLNATAVSREEFDKERFDALTRDNALILVDIFANWCPTCARQREILDRYQQQNPDAPLHILTVNYNTQREWVRHFGATRQSTFLLYRGTERIWMSVAETSEDRITARLDEALNNLPAETPKETP